MDFEIELSIYIIIAAIGVCLALGGITVRTWEFWVIAFLLPVHGILNRGIIYLTIYRRRGTL